MLLEKISMKLLLLFTFFALLMMPIQVFASPDLEDGTYTIGYTVLHADNDSASIANDYWEKPATLYVEDGQMKLEMTLNHSSWITEFKTPVNGSFQDVNVIRTDDADDKRVVQFPVDDLSSPLAAHIHVIVEDINYDHSYTIRFDFDLNQINPVSVQSESEGKQEENNGSVAQIEDDDENEDRGGATNQEANPQTGDLSFIWLYALATIVFGFILVRKVNALGRS
ncbi:heme uptake protein IsdC [Alkalihalobacillus hemicellulosilyticus]|uniref:NPQTN cell wall anchored protein IsdC n=1 Tax=Halalkalibacter hemicellulosilyticusJCM 9152 TaxID=1236971 RepID=W4QHC6_9BACI|nr:heme uptake protein IsdC [Halalkalibacter hemicellulosilyticus]GAE31053.1 NPQTN cell wall anchored protein IsdC [Halalkalibacter hemicellulosilyticusJCM 9152]